MNDVRFLPLIEWIAEAGLSGHSELRLLEAFCERALDPGLPLTRAVIGIDTLRPVLEGRLFEWRRDGDGPVQPEYGRLDPQRSDDKWLQSRSIGSTRVALTRCADASVTGSWNSLCWWTCGASA